MKKLLEAEQYQFYVSGSNKRAISFKKSSNYVPPVIFIIAMDDKEIAQSSDIMLLKVNSVKFKNLYANQSMGRTSAQMLDQHNNIIRHIMQPSQLNNQEDYDAFRESFEINKDWLENYGAFKVFKFSNAKSLNLFLATKINLTPQIIERLTGVPFDDAVEEAVAVGDTEIIFPDTMRDSRKKDITHIIQQSNSILSNHGVGVLTKCKMIVSPIPGKTVGLYYVGTGQIKIDPTAKYSYTAVRTIVHEYGHKWYFEHLTKEQHEAIKNAYLKAREENPPTPYKVSDEDAKKAAQNLTKMKEIMANLKVGDEITYQGRKRSFKERSPYIIKDLGIADMTLVAADGSRNSGLKGGIWSFIDNGFYHDGKLITVKAEDAEPEVKTLQVLDGWFPSEYSRKDSEEWFAELFAFSLMGELKSEEADKFLKSFL